MHWLPLLYTTNATGSARVVSICTQTGAGGRNYAES